MSGPTYEPHPDALSLEERIVAAIRRLMRAVDLHSRRLADSCGLTGPQLATLGQAARQGPLSASALARAVHLSGPTLTGILQRLERRGLVTRRRGAADRRTVVVEATAAGLEVLRRAPSLLQDRFRAELTRLREWEQLMMLANLQRIAELMDAESLDAAPHLTNTELATTPPAVAPEPTTADLFPWRPGDPVAPAGPAAR